jgi:hypothetical protein
MIDVYYAGAFGNNLFQYAAGRIISKKNLYFLNKHKPGNFLETIDEDNQIKIFNNTLSVRGNKLDYENIFKHKGRIYLEGFYQCYENFRNYKDYIKKIYYFEKDKQLYDDSLIGVHIRLTDYTIQNHHLPMEYYIDCIKDSKKFPIIYTDDPHSDYIKELKGKINCEVRCNSEWQDFLELSSYKNILISQSSFSWWSAWLSNATKIYYPLTPKNYWRHNKDIDDANLIVTDEPRYILV